MQAETSFPFSGNPGTSELPSELAAVRSVGERLMRRLAAAVLGREDVIEQLTIALLADGHVLLEDYPGSGKTTLARALGEAIRSEARPAGTQAIANFRRIQFTPDLLPSDITGTTIFEPEERRFSFRPGPIFAHIVLADEINRTSPKVQAAMLEAMAEKQVTVDDLSHPLDDLFCVIATQNPLDVAGTYPLPTPQLDRFLFKLTMHPIARAAELQLLTAYPEDRLGMAAQLPAVSRSEVIEARHTLRRSVVVAASLRGALVDLARQLRLDQRLQQGLSTRALLLALPALQARAVLHGRNHVTPDDLAQLAPPLFRHRLQAAPGQEVDAILAKHLGACVEELAKTSLRT